MLDKSKTYLIVGLGLLGGKYAQVLSQKGYRVTGITHSRSTLDYALTHGYIRAGKTEDFADLVQAADCVIFGLYPAVLLEWVRKGKSAFGKRDTGKGFFCKTFPDIPAVPQPFCSCSGLRGLFPCSWQQQWDPTCPRRYGGYIKTCILCPFMESHMAFCQSYK